VIHKFAPFKIPYYYKSSPRDKIVQVVFSEIAGFVGDVLEQQKNMVQVVRRPNGQNIDRKFS